MKQTTVFPIYGLGKANEEGTPAFDAEIEACCLLGKKYDDIV